MKENKITDILMDWKRDPMGEDYTKFFNRYFFFNFNSPAEDFQDK